MSAISLSTASFLKGTFAEAGSAEGVLEPVGFALSPALAADVEEAASVEVFAESVFTASDDGYSTRAVTRGTEFSAGFIGEFWPAIGSAVCACTVSRAAEPHIATPRTIAVLKLVVISNDSPRRSASWLKNALALTKGKRQMPASPHFRVSTESDKEIAKVLHGLNKLRG